MSLNRRAASRDKNERPIIQALEGAGAWVKQLSGADVPDLLVAFQGKLFLLEVKNPDQHGNWNRSGQKQLRKELDGLAVVVWNSGEALEAIGAGNAAPVILDSVVIRFPYICAKLSNGASHRTHLLDFPELARASAADQRRRFVYGDRVEWFALGLTISLEDIKGW